MPHTDVAKLIVSAVARFLGATRSSRNRLVFRNRLKVIARLLTLSLGVTLTLSRLNSVMAADPGGWQHQRTRVILIDGPSRSSRPQPSTSQSRPSVNVPQVSPQVRDAESSLVAKQFERKKSVFVLNSETDVKEKLAGLRIQANLFNQAAIRLGEIQSAIATLSRLEQEIINADEMIGKLDFEMGRYGSFNYRNSTYRGNNFTDHQGFEAIRLQRDTLVQNRRSMDADQRRLWSQKPGQQVSKATEEFERQRNSSVISLRELREAIAVTTKEYDRLEADDQVKKALVVIGSVKLGPSSDFQICVRELNKFEKSIGAKVTSPKMNPALKKTR